MLLGQKRTCDNNVELQADDEMQFAYMFNYLKDLWTDKLKCLYILVFGLQVLFLLLQFLPMMKLSTDIKETQLLGYTVDVTMVTKNFSMFGFCSEEPMVLCFYGIFLVLFCLSLKSTAQYLTAKEKKFGGFGLAKTSVVLLLLWFVLVTTICKEGVADYEEYGAIFELLFGGSLYWVVAIALLISLFVLSVKAKEAKREAEVAKRVEEEMRKKEQEAKA